MTHRKLSVLTLLLALALGGSAFGQAQLGEPAPGYSKTVVTPAKKTGLTVQPIPIPSPVIYQDIPAPVLYQDKAQPKPAQPMPVQVVPAQPVPVKPAPVQTAPALPATTQPAPGAVVVQPAQPYAAYSYNTCNGNSCGSNCGHGHKSCNIEWLKPWTCEDLEMKPFEAKKSCHCQSFLQSLLWCPPEPEEPKEENGNGEKKNGNGNGNGEKKNGNGNGEAKNGNGEAKNGNGEAKNGNGNGEEKKEEEEEEAEEPETPTPLMAAIQCYFPHLYQNMECNGTKVYGWLQGGFTANPASPSDRLNYGVNFNNRSNAAQLNQAYIVLERPVDLVKKKDCFHIGYRVDFFGGHDAPYWENLDGVFPNFTGDQLEVSRLNDIGISLPQAFVDIHLPVLTDRGVDIRLGRFYTLMGYEVNPAPSTNFYSHMYEFFYGCAFTHTGALAIVHIGDTIDFTNGLVRGWDVALSDVNDTFSYVGNFTWNSCDKRQNVSVTWIYGPEQVNNNQNDRVATSAYYTRLFGCYNEWKVITGGHICWEQNASLAPSGTSNSAEWYGYSGQLLYTVSPKLILGARGEWFHDDDGARTVFANSDNGGAAWNRPGYAGSFYAATFGVTYKPYQNFRIRPEVRFDWFDGAAINGTASRPFNDQQDNFQTTFGFDMIWEF